MDSDKVRSRKELQYPKSVFFIACNVFCERFSYYGIRTILVLYLRNKLYYSEDESMVTFHVFSMFSYLFALFGAILADSWLGKFRTIFYVSIIYAIGQVILTISATPPLNLPARTFAIVGLALIAIGNGGIEPCISAFGGDQFVLPQQKRHLTIFFSLFFFIINTATLASTFIVPILRRDVACFGDNTCYSLGFFLPTMLMILSVAGRGYQLVTFVCSFTVILYIGKPSYTMKISEGNVVLDVTKCIARAISNKYKSRKGHEREHWLDYADDKYDRKMIADVKSALAVLKMFLLLPIYWALVGQQGSRWLIQATRMDGRIGSFLLKPDQMLMVNPILVMIFIPIFQFCIYPALAKLRIVRTPLQKFIAGGLLTGLAFVIAALVEFQLEKTYAVIPSTGLSQVRIFNTLNCPVIMSVGNESFVLDSLSVWEDKYVEANGIVELNYTANYARCSTLGMTPTLVGDRSGIITAIESAAVSWVITPTGIAYNYVDSVDQTTTGDPAVRALMNLNKSTESTATLEFVENSGVIFSMNVTSNSAESNKLIEFEPATYDVYLNSRLIRSSVELSRGGVYTVLVNADDNDKVLVKIIKIRNPNSMHMLWLLPQYIAITSGEVMFCITGLEFAFTQAPANMKSLIMACWLVTVAFGDLIVVIITKIFTFESQASAFFLFAGLMWIDMLIFGIMAIFYKYVEQPSAESSNIDISLRGKHGTANASFRNDDES